MPSKTQKWTAVAVGAGPVTVQSPQPVRGEIKTVGIHYGGSAPGTTTVQINTADSDFNVHQAILALPAGNTDAWYQPRPAAQDKTGATDLYAVGGTPVPMWFFVDGYLNLTINNAAAGASVTAVVLIGDD